MRFLVVAGLAGAAALLGAGAPRANIPWRRPAHPDAACRAPVLDTARARRLADAVEVAAGRAVPGGYVSLEAAARPVTFGRRCLAAVTLSHDGELGGGIVVVDPARPGEALDVGGEYPGAREPFDAGAGRVGFTYTAGRGSGLYESRVVVLCALDAGVWDECLSVTRRKVTSVCCYAQDGPGPRGPVYMEQDADVRVAGDTLLLDRRVEYRRFGAGPARRVRLGTSRLVLPP